VDEAQLSARFRVGDQAAVRDAFTRYSGAVFTVAMSVLNDRELAADAVQMTFLNAWRASASLDPESSMGPWLYAIARHASLDLYRSRRRAPSPVDGDLLKERADTSPISFEHAWETWEIRSAIDALPAEEREIVRAQHFLALTHAEIAARLGIPLGTVKSRSHRAHRRLATLLGHLVEVVP
jgi:RNA polymerase sigma-70 factor (ECF subfamily)